eukprot:53167_1
MSTQKNNLLAICCAITASFLCATEDALSKLSGLQVPQIIIFKCLFELLVGMIYWYILQKRDTKNELGNWYGNKPYILLIWIYGFFRYLDILCFWSGIRSVPIGISYCILSSSDAIIVFVGFMCFKEPLFRTFIPTVIFRVVALLLIIQKPTFIFNIFIPNMDDNELHNLSIPGLLFVSIASIGWTASNIAVAATENLNSDNDETDNQSKSQVHFLQFENTNSFQNIILWMPLTMIINSFTIHNKYMGNIQDIETEWKYDLYSIFMLIIISALGFSFVILNIISYQIGDATKIIWFENIDLIASYCYQIFLFNDIPNHLEIVGAILTVIAAFFPLSEEIYDHCKKPQYQPVSMNSDTQSDSDALTLI